MKVAIPIPYRTAVLSWLYSRVTFLTKLKLRVWTFLKEFTYLWHNDLGGSRHRFINGNAFHDRCWRHVPLPWMQQRKTLLPLRFHSLPQPLMPHWCVYLMNPFCPNRRNLWLLVVRAVCPFCFRSIKLKIPGAKTQNCLLHRKLIIWHVIRSSGRTDGLPFVHLK